MISLDNPAPIGGGSLQKPLQTFSGGQFGERSAQQTAAGPLKSGDTHQDQVLSTPLSNRAGQISAENLIDILRAAIEQVLPEQLEKSLEKVLQAANEEPISVRLRDKEVLLEQLMGALENYHSELINDGEDEKGPALQRLNKGIADIQLLRQSLNKESEDVAEQALELLASTIDDVEKALRGLEEAIDADEQSQANSEKTEIPFYKTKAFARGIKVCIALLIAAAALAVLLVPAFNTVAGTAFMIGGVIVDVVSVAFVINEWADAVLDRILGTHHESGEKNKKKLKNRELDSSLPQENKENVEKRFKKEVAVAGKEMKKADSQRKKLQKVKKDLPEARLKLMEQVENLKKRKQFST